MSEPTYSVSGMSCTHRIRSISIDDVRRAAANAGYELVGAMS